MLIAATPFARLRGLLGRRRFAGTCILPGCGDVHTLGMDGPIDVAFADDAGIVVAVFRNVAPWSRRRVRGASCAIERRAQDGPWLRRGDALTLCASRSFDESEIERGDAQ